MLKFLFSGCLPTAACILCALFGMYIGCALSGDLVAYKNQPAASPPKQSGDGYAEQNGTLPSGSTLTIPALPPPGTAGGDWLQWLWENKGIFLTDVIVLYTMFDRRVHGNKMVKKIKDVENGISE